MRYAERGFFSVFLRQTATTPNCLTVMTAISQQVMTELYYAIGLDRWHVNFRQARFKGRSRWMDNTNQKLGTTPCLQRADNSEQSHLPDKDKLPAILIERQDDRAF
ncbi:hypothetical protein P9K31_10580 [Corynebacterium glutamicum]|uniref:hypothetical protein n=1 Tax=Corynebacterium TaxID=1716 RepID=UPI00071FD958|nr:MULTISPECIES: hypothetical protein [Corynebacterium]ALP49545.1 hypothetical protein AC079_04575 [Corynebacterium glutamicum]ANU33057.1 hypothetical protein BBD29_04370 [Corynebacterium glutamicum]APT06800.1 hypothetical protein BSP99_04485 [Corynebacterium glutamicum]QWQ83721.1 hypothetical protein B5C28_04450 [Corynebacterium glutamicum]WFP70897.1 hypothetical protein P9K31_10580 [Corynebacterium glutamicum]